MMRASPVQQRFDFLRRYIFLRGLRGSAGATSRRIFVPEPTEINRRHKAQHDGSHDGHGTFVTAIHLVNPCLVNDFDLLLYL
jgi:hypothetical protein